MGRRTTALLIASLVLGLLLHPLGALAQSTSPMLEVNTPPGVVSQRRYELTGRTDPGATVKVEGVMATVRADGTWYRVVDLKPGANSVSIAAQFRSGTPTRTVVNILFDPKAQAPVRPRLTIAQLPRVVSTNVITIQGEGQPGAELWINGRFIRIISGTFAEPYTLSPGENIIVVELRGPGEQVDRQTITIGFTPAQGATSTPTASPPQVVVPTPAPPQAFPPVVVPTVPTAGAYPQGDQGSGYGVGATLLPGGNTGVMTVTFYMGQAQVAYNGLPRAIDVTPQTLGGQILIPLRFAAEGFGATVTFDYASGVVQVADGPVRITLNSRGRELWQGDQLMILEQQPLNWRSRIMLPIPVVATVLRARVNWDVPGAQVTLSRPSGG